MRKCFLVTLSIFISTFAWCQTAPQLIEKAKQQYKKGNLNAAVNLYTQAIAKSKDSCRYYSSRSRIYLELAKAKEAFDDICEAIKICPRDPYNFMQRGYIYYILKKADKSILDYGVAIDLATSDSLKALALANRSSSKMLNRDFKGCEIDCRAALSLDSLSIVALNNLAMCLDDLERGNEAMPYLEKIIKIDSTATFAIMNMGFKLTQEGRYDEALGYYNKAINQGYKQAYVYNNRGFARLKLGDVAGARDDIQKSIKLDPYNSFAYRNLGYLNLAEGEIPKACKNWDKAISLGFTKVYGKEVEELLKKHCL
jgi:tetratricopeptide (TPR) repeat protein